MQKVIILRGLPFSGKTTWAKKFNNKQGRSFVIFDVKDELAYIREQHPEFSIRELRDAADKKLTQTICAGYSVIVDDDNILDSHMERIFKCIHVASDKTGQNVVACIKEVHTPIWLCVSRGYRADRLESLACQKKMVQLEHYYRYCLRKQIIYSNEENSKANLQVHQVPAVVS